MQTVRLTHPGRPELPLPFDFTSTQSSRWEMQTAFLEQASSCPRKARGASVVGPRIGIHNAVWYGGLDPTERQRVSQDAQFLTCSPKDAVCVKGEQADSWFGVVSGVVAITRSSRHGRPATIAGIPPGGWFGAAALIKGEAYCHDARALKRSVIAKLPSDTFYWLLERSISFNRYVMWQQNERLWQLLEAQDIDGLLDTDAKVARRLGLLFHPTLYPRNGFRLNITQRELADFCDLSRQRVNQALTRLERRRWIHVEYGSIRVLDLASLQQRPLLSRSGCGASAHRV